MKTAINSFFQSMLVAVSLNGSIEPKKILEMFGKSDLQPVFLEKYREFVESCSLRILIEHHQHFYQNSSNGHLVCSASDFLSIAHEKLFSTSVEKVFAEPGITVQEIMYIRNHAEKDLSNAIDEKIADFFVKDVLKRNLIFQSFEAEYGSIIFNEGPEKLHRCYRCVQSKFMHEYLQTICTFKDLKSQYCYVGNDHNKFLFLERLEQILSAQSLQDARNILESYSKASNGKTIELVKKMRTFVEKAEIVHREELCKKLLAVTTLVGFISLGKEVVNVEGAKNVFANLLRQDKPCLEKAKGLFQIYPESESFIETLVEYYQEEIPKMNVGNFRKLWDIRFQRAHDEIGLLLVNPMILAIEVEYNLNLLGYPLGSSGFEGEEEIKIACRKRAGILIARIIEEITSLERVRFCWRMVEENSAVEKRLEKKYLSILQATGSVEFLEKLLPDQCEREDLLHTFAIRRYKVVLMNYLKQEHSFDELCLRRRKAPWKMRSIIEEKMVQVAKQGDVESLSKMFLRKDFDSGDVLRKISNRLYQILPAYLAKKRSMDELLLVFRAVQRACHYSPFDWSCVRKSMEKVIENEKSLIELFRIYAEYEKLEVYDSVKVLDRCKEEFPSFLSALKSEQEIREAYEACPLLFKRTFLMLCRNAMRD